MHKIDKLITIKDVIRWAVSQFNEHGLYYGHGTDNAWDEAITLILHALHLPHEINPTFFDARLTVQERELLYTLIQRRIHERVPVPYLTHEAWFAGLPYYVDERVLIPRSPIAELIENHFQPWLENDTPDILDLCTGSGCIAIACAKAFLESHIDASDISQDALTVAKINILRHEVEDRVHLYTSQLFDALPQKKYDLIISNPPYVNTQEMLELPPEYHHEPRLGLDAGLLGLDLVLQILCHAQSFLKPNGILVVEVGNSEDALQEKFPEVPFTWLEFQRGGGGVFLLNEKQLRQYGGLFKKSKEVF